MGILSTESDRVVERFLIFYFDHQFRFVEVGGFGAFLRSIAVRFASSNLSGAYSFMNAINSLYFSSSGMRRSAFCNSLNRFSRSLSVIFFSSLSRLYSVIKPISIFFNFQRFISCFNGCLRFLNYFFRVDFICFKTCKLGFLFLLLPLVLGRMLFITSDFAAFQSVSNTDLIIECVL